MSIKSIFDHIIQGTNMSPMEVTAWLILTALFIWLYKEFKEQYQRKVDKTNHVTEQSMTHYSKLLKAYYNEKPNEFFSSVYESLPYMNVILMNEILKELEDVLKSEQEKMTSIKNKILREVKSIKNDNKEWKHIKLPLEGTLYFVKKFQVLYYSIVMPVFTLYVGTFFMLIWFSGSNANLSTLRVSAIVIMLFMIIIFLELLVTNRLKWKKYTNDNN